MALDPREAVRRELGPIGNAIVSLARAMDLSALHAWPARRQSGRSHKHAIGTTSDAASRATSHPGLDEPAVNSSLTAA
jgi:hypothetical protein